MSTTIDERVVEMRFDNRQFEAGVKTSLSTLDKLKEGLDLDGAAKGLKGLGDAAKKCDLSTLSNSVEICSDEILGARSHGGDRPFKHYQLGHQYRKTDDRIVYIGAPQTRL